MNGYLSTGSTSLLNHDAIIPRLRVMRNTIAPTRSQEDVEPSPSLTRSSSSSSSARRRAYAHEGTNLAEDFSHVARASTSGSDSAAARLRELTRRVPVIGAPTSTSVFPARSSSPELVYFDTASEAGTIKQPAGGVGREPKDPHAVPIPSDLDSDLDRMAENAFKPHPSRIKSAQEKLHELVALVTTDDEKVVTPPKLRTRTLSFTSPPPQRHAMKRVSLSDEEAETTSSRHSSSNTRLRKERSSTPSLDVLRARLNSPSVHAEVFNDTPARPRVAHPLYAELESANLSGELPNPTPHHSFSKNPPFRTSTPRNSHDRTASVDSDQSSYTMSPFRASSALRPPLQLRPASPTPKGPGPQPEIAVGRRKRISLNPARPEGAARSAGDSRQEYSEDESGDEPNDGEGSRDNSPAMSPEFPSRYKSFASSAQSISGLSSTTGSTTAVKLRQRSSPPPSFASASKENRNSPSPRLANPQIMTRNSPSPRLAGAQPMQTSPQFTARASRVVADPAEHPNYYSRASSVTDSGDEIEGQVSFGSRQIGSTHSNTLEQEETRSMRAIKQPATAIQGMGKYQSGTFKSEYDAYVKEQRAAREQGVAQPDGLSERRQSTASVITAASQLREDTSTGLRPSTPPSPAASIPLPPSPTVGNSPTRQPALSKDRDLERLRKATSTATTSPRKEYLNRIFQHGDELELDPLTAPAFQYSTPAPSKTKSTLDRGSETDEASRIDQDADVSRMPTSFATPPRPYQGIRHKRNQLQTPLRPEDLPDLPPPPEFPELPIHVGSASAAKSKGRAGSVDRDFTFPTSSSAVSEGPEPKTPRPPGAWDNSTVASSWPKESRTPPETHLGSGSKGASITGTQTPAPPGSWAVKSEVTPIFDDSNAPMVEDDNSQLQTPAPPGVWPSAVAAPSANNSLKKGILKVRFDETSVASWNELQRMTGDTDPSELDNSFTLGHEKVRKSIPGRFLSTSKAEAAQVLSASSGSKTGSRTQQHTKSPSGSVRKRKSRLRMVDEFGNALDEQPAIEEDGEDENEMPRSESPSHDDDLPATSEEIRGLRRVARALPHIAREFADESISVTAPAPITSPAEQLRSDERVADLGELSRVARVERARLQRKLQLVRNPGDSLGHKVSQPQSGVARHGVQDGRSKSRRWMFTVLFVEIILFYFVLRYTATRAEHLFLTTHFDPFFPVIYSPPVPTSSSLFSRLLNLLLSIPGSSPSPPPPVHIVFGLIPRTIVPRSLLALLDKVNSLSNLDFAAAFRDGKLYSAGATWVPS